MLIPDLYKLPAGHAPIPARTALVAVGWLGSQVPSVGETPPQCIDRLVEARDKGFLIDDYSRGWHDCEICPRASPIEPVNHRVTWRGRDLDLRGHGHFLVLAKARFWQRRVAYVFPELILHYIIAHRYQPPGEFVRAVQVGQFSSEASPMRIDAEPFAVAASGRTLMEALAGEQDATQTRTIPLSGRQRACVARLFPREHVAEAERRLATLTGERDGATPESLDRLRLAAIRVSGGSIGRLREALDIAARDWRDLLVEAGFAGDASAHVHWTPRPLTNRDMTAWRAGEAVPNVAFTHDVQVEIVQTRHAGKRGRIHELVGLEPEARYVVRLAAGEERVFPQSALRHSTRR